MSAPTHGQPAHVLVVTPLPDEALAGDLTLDERCHFYVRHLRTGDGCDGWCVECYEPHLVEEALMALIEDKDAPEDQVDVADRMLDDLRSDDGILLHGQPHSWGYTGWTVPVDGCGPLSWDVEFDLPCDLLPGVHAVEFDQFEWGDPAQVTLTGEPVDDPDVLLRLANTEDGAR